MATNTETQSSYEPGTALGLGPNPETPVTQNLELEETNRAALLASGQIPEGTPDSLAQESVYQATYGLGNPTFESPVISSSEAASEVDGQFAEAQAQLAQLPQYETYQDFSSEMQTSRDSAKTEFDTLKDTITQDFETRAAEQTQQNRLTTGFNTAMLAKNRALGVSISGMSYMKGVEIQNQRELTKIQTEKSKALLMATEAYLKNDWTLLTAQMDRADKLTDQANQIEQWQFEDAMASNEELRKQARFGWEAEDRAMGKLDAMISSGADLSSLDRSEITSLEEQAGLPAGYFDALYEANKAAADLADEIELQKTINDLRAQTPTGMSFMIDGVLYTGWDTSNKDTWESTFTDNAGNVTLVSYDRATGITTEVPLGNIGSADNGWTLEEVDGAYYRVNTDLGVSEPIVTPGGAVDPSYLPGFEDWAQSIGQTTVAFGGETGFEGMHPGWDFANTVGTDITAFMGGTVTKIDNIGTSAYGKYIEVTDADGRVHRYSHLNSINVTNGQTVGKNSSIGSMGNTGNVLTSDGAGGYREPTAEERTAGKGAHLDYRVFKSGDQLATTPEVDTGHLPEGMTQEDVDYTVDIMSSDINSITDPSEKAEAYTYARSEVAKQGTAALAWFDKTFPSENYITDASNLPAFSDLTAKKLLALSPTQIIQVAERDGQSFSQLAILFNDFENIEAEQVVDIAASLGASYDDLKKILAKGGVGPFFDRFTSDIKAYAQEKLKSE